MKKIQSTVVKQPKALYQLRVGTRVTALLILFIAFVGLFLSKDYMIERKLLVDVPNEKITEYLSEPNNWPNWLYIQDGRLVYKQAKSEVIEFDINYNSGKQGLLKLSVIDSNYINFTVVPVLGQNPVLNVIHWDDQDEGVVQVSWTISGRLDSGILSSYLAFFANKIAGANFEKSLIQLQDRLAF